MSVCDLRSVGVIVTDPDGLFLMFERATFPIGIAPPAGHVDDHATPADAARAEVLEEVGLKVVKLEQLLPEVWRPNRCRRDLPPEAKPDDAGHWWTIFGARVTGELAPSARETRGARWYHPHEVNGLMYRTMTYASDGMTHAEWTARPGIEPVWMRWLSRYGMREPRLDVLSMPPLRRVEKLAERGPDFPYPEAAG